MALSVRLPVAALVAVTGALACGGGDSTEPVTPDTIVIADGNGQSAPTGFALDVPLKVTVVGSDGRPFYGAIVTWTVTTGSAALSDPTSTTDSAGAASVTVLFGNQIGPVSVRASVPGTSPVSFSLTVLDPCDYFVPYTLGTFVSANLSTTDCLLGNSQEGWYTDLYAFTLGTQQGLQISMSSPTFDTWLDLVSGTFANIAFSDDIVFQVNTNSQIDIIAAPGNYIAAPNSFDPFTTGPYTFSAVAQPQPLAECALVWLTRGVSLSDSVTTGDCTLTDTSGTYYMDAVAIIAAAGSVLKVAQRSTAFDAFLALYRYDPLGDSLALVASNDDSAGIGPNAYLVATAPALDVYTLLIGTSGAAQTGSYTLAVSSSTTATTPMPLAAMFRTSKQGGLRGKPLPRSRPVR